jgi:predicted Rossmann-fold nucleotide-binding protein
MITWAQLGLHQKPLGLLNVEGFFDPLLDMLDNMIKEGFVKEENRSMIKVHSNAEALLQAL